MMYKGTLLTDTISIHEVFTIHYFEYMSDFSFAGESHNFWEFVFVDKGENRMSFTGCRRPEALPRILS